jgi:hypothetical protein
MKNSGRLVIKTITTITTEVYEIESKNLDFTPDIFPCIDDQAISNSQYKEPIASRISRDVKFEVLR